MNLPVFNLLPEQAQALSNAIRDHVDDGAYTVNVSRVPTYGRSLYLVDAHYGDHNNPKVQVESISPDGDRVVVHTHQPFH